MQDDPESGPEVDAWELFALAACQPLRGLPGCVVAPQLDAGAVVRALDGYLRPRPDELLLAIVEQPGPTGPAPACALTSRRILWPDPREPLGSARSARSLPYDRLPPSVSAGGGLEPRVDLGGGRAIPLRSPESPGAAEALAGVLSTISRARRSGDLAGSTSREALNRARAEIGQVVRQAAALHRVGGAVRSFQADVQAATPRVVITPLIVAACLLAFGAMALSGVSPIAPSVPDLIAWGGNVGAAAALLGQWWRLPTSVFLHGGLIHLGVNLWVLSRVGPLVERLYGNAGFALLYLAAGIGGALASAWWHPQVVSIGASGAIFGLIGGLGAFLVSHRAAIPPQVVAGVRGGVIAFVVYNTLFGLAIPGIDNAAHLGGLASGFLAGLVLRRPWPVPSPTAGLARQLLGGLAIAGGLLLIGRAVAGEIRRDLGPLAPADDPSDRPLQALRSLNEALGPPLGRLGAIGAELDELLGRLLDAPELDPAERDRVDALIDRSEENRTSLARVEADDPDLAAVRDAAVAAQDAMTGSLRALRRSLDDPDDPSAIDGPEGFVHFRDEFGRQLDRFQSLRRSYMNAHGLVEVPSAVAEPDG